MRRRTICALAVVAAAALTALRVWQYLWIIDVTTGFFTGTDVTVYLLYGSLAVFTLLAGTVAMVDKTIGLARTPFLRARPLGGVLLLTGGATLVRAILAFAGGDYGSTIDLKAIAMNLLTLAAAAVFIYYGCSLIGGRTLNHKLLPLVPALWVVIRLLTLFRISSTVTPISESLLSLLSLICLSVYFLYFAFSYAGFFSASSARWMFLTSLLSFVLIVPNTLGMLLSSFANAFYSLEPVWYVERVADLCLAFIPLFTALYTAFDNGAAEQLTSPETPAQPGELGGELPQV